MDVETSPPRGSIKAYKVILLGDGGVGKTSFFSLHGGEDPFGSNSVKVRRLTLDAMRGKVQENDVTQEKDVMGGNDLIQANMREKDVMQEKDVMRGNDLIHLTLWDTNGQERFGGLRDGWFIGKFPMPRGPIYLLTAIPTQGTHAAIVMYDVTSRTSWRNVFLLWLKDLNRVVGAEVPIVLLGNKVDIRPEKPVFKVDREVSRFLDRRSHQRVRTSWVKKVVLRVYMIFKKRLGKDMAKLCAQYIIRSRRQIEWNDVSSPFVHDMYYEISCKTSSRQELEQPLMFLARVLTGRLDSFSLL